ncbi:hypothetical protein E4T56_gene5418 [Termitomyces sp. T112]|nr:hypothetical protein E4T56_gene5418 [Termitomyces sp. T112]
MPSPPLLGSPLHWTSTEFPVPPTPLIIALLPPPMPPTAPYALAALEAVTVIPWWSPWRCPYLYMPSPIPSKPHPVPSKAHPSLPPPYELPPHVWPTTFPTPPPNTAGKPWQPTMTLPQTAQLRPWKLGIHLRGMPSAYPCHALQEPPPSTQPAGATACQLPPLPQNPSLRPYPSDPPPTAWQPTYSPTPALPQYKQHTNSE